MALNLKASTLDFVILVFNVYFFGKVPTSSVLEKLKTSIPFSHEGSQTIVSPGTGFKNKEAFLDVTPKDWIDAAKEALAIGHLLGDKVGLMSCSTGSTLSVYLAAENPEAVDGLIMYLEILRICLRRKFWVFSCFFCEKNPNE